MHPRERVLVYTLLFASLLVGGLSLLGVASPAAHAQDAPAALPSIALAGEKELVLTNKGGRIAWADNDFAKAYSIGFVHIGKVLRQLHESEAFKEETDALVKELDEADGKYREQLDAIRERAQTIQQDSPEGAQLREEWNKIYSEYMEWGQTAVQRRNKLDASHFEKAYRDLVEATEVVAERKGIDIVYRFIATSDPFEATDGEQALNEIRLRTVLRYPQGLDITSDVLSELSLKDE